MEATIMIDRAEPGPDTNGPSWRPHYHYAPRGNWLSDPNGLVWHDGEWHLFYQYNPHGDQWGHMSWGHAVSRDLVHWRELPVAIAEDARHMIFSGSAIVAPEPAGDSPAIVAFYTGAERGEGGRQVQCRALSHDGGRTFSADPANPILDEGRSDFRDPKVFWHGPSAAYVMVAVFADDSMACLYRSTDLVHWTRAGTIGPFALPGRVWECPDLIELPIAGEGGAAWMFKVDLLHVDPGVTGSGAIVLSGRFDGHAFTPDVDDRAAPRWRWVDHGRDFYAAVGWNGAPPGDDRRIWIGWIGNHRYQGMLPETGWRGAMTVPRALSWTRGTDGTLHLRQDVVQELDELCGPRVPLDDICAKDAEDRVWAVDMPRALRLACLVAPDPAGALTLSIEAPDGRGVDLRFDAAGVRLDRSRCGTVPADAAGYHDIMHLPLTFGGAHAIDLWVDDHTIELFAEGGTSVLTAMTFLPPGPLTLIWRGEGARGTVIDANWSAIDKG